MTYCSIPTFPPPPGRAHEACGPGAMVFAFAVAARVAGQVFWVREGWRPERMNPAGISEFFDPAKLLVADATNQTEVLAVSEEALRAGTAPLVVMELNMPLGLTEGRRLQLAARAGKATALAIIPEGMGSNAAETRWHCAPVFDPRDSTLQRWELIKNKSGTLGAWHVRWDTSSRRFIVVSPAGQQPGPENAPG